MLVASSSVLSPGLSQTLVGDLEACTQASAEPAMGVWMGCWDPETLVQGRYTAASDLYHLGLMLQKHGGLVSTKQRTDFLQHITQTASSQRETAEGLLRCDWLCCQGKHCKTAGAQHGEAGG